MIPVPMHCYCGHDCARCKVYLATVRGDEALREQSRQFYKAEFNLDVPLQGLYCLGGHSELVMPLCRGCPWMACAKTKGLAKCKDCGEYPCEPLAAYQKKYVNHQYNQTDE